MLADFPRKSRCWPDVRDSILELPPPVLLVAVANGTRARLLPGHRPGKVIIVQYLPGSIDPNQRRSAAEISCRSVILYTKQAVNQESLKWGRKNYLQNQELKSMVNI